MSNKAVFIDRDGTINEDMGYINHIDRFVLFPKSIEAIKLINNSGFKAVIVTNQSGVARGYFPESLINKIHNKLEEILKQNGAYIDAIYYCPHHPNGLIEKYKIECDCRKPKPGMLFRASKDLDINLKQSFTIGDKISDINLAFRVGAKGILVKTGYGKGELEYNQDKWNVQPHHIAEDFYEAAQWIVSH